jgi:hypothetical protein
MHEDSVQLSAARVVVGISRMQGNEVNHDVTVLMSSHSTYGYTVLE